jgi:hypothetical protein
MEHLSTQVEHQQIEWRRIKVLELSSQGHSQREIANFIHVGIGTVNRDLTYLSTQAQDNLKTHVQQRLPEQYQKCMNGLNQILKIGWSILNSDSSTVDHRLRALALINELIQVPDGTYDKWGYCYRRYQICSVKDGPFKHCRKETIAKYQGG